MVKSVWSSQCGQVSVVKSVWSSQCGQVSVVKSVWSSQCGHVSVVKSVWSSQCGQVSVVKSVWSSQCGQVSVRSGNPCPVIVNENKLDRLPIFYPTQYLRFSHKQRKGCADTHKLHTSEFNIFKVLETLIRDHMVEFLVKINKYISTCVPKNKT